MARFEIPTPCWGGVIFYTPRMGGCMILIHRKFQGFENGFSHGRKTVFDFFKSGKRQI